MPPEAAEPRRQFNSLVSRLGATAPHVSIETRSPSVIKAIVARTDFLGWLPEPLYAAEQACGLIRPLAVKEMDMRRRFFVYRRRRSFTSPAMSKFLEELNKVKTTRL
jgi:DNA-binding transcriptional LysR family regulator